MPTQAFEHVTPHPRATATLCGGTVMEDLLVHRATELGEALLLALAPIFPPLDMWANSEGSRCLVDTPTHSAQTEDC